jgi:hypothetical protein
MLLNGNIDALALDVFIVSDPSVLHIFLCVRFVYHRSSIWVCIITPIIPNRIV